MEPEEGVDMFDKENPFAENFVEEIDMGEEFNIDEPEQNEPLDPFPMDPIQEPKPEEVVDVEAEPAVDPFADAVLDQADGKELDQESPLTQWRRERQKVLEQRRLDQEKESEAQRTRALAAFEEQKKRIEEGVALMNRQNKADEQSYREEKDRVLNEGTLWEKVGRMIPVNEHNPQKDRMRLLIKGGVK